MYKINKKSAIFLYYYNYQKRENNTIYDSIKNNMNQEGERSVYTENNKAIDAGNWKRHIQMKIHTF